jgi:hypothetical protein
MKNNKQFYINSYNNLVNKAKEEFETDLSKGLCNDDALDDYIQQYETGANTNEVVGYYLVWYDQLANKQWLQNTSCKMILTKQDQEVTKILNSLEV